jgi:AraC family ethanolamine operon transcriptional activator
MTRIVLRDFDEFPDAIDGMIGRLLPTSRSTEQWWVQSVAIGRLRIQTFQIGGPVTFAGDGTPDSVALHIPLTDPAKIRIDGELLEQGSFLLLKEGQPFTLTTLEPTGWFGIVVPLAHELLTPELVKSRVSLLLDEKTTSHAETNEEHLDSIRSIAAWLSAAIDNRSFGEAGVRRAYQEIIAAVSQTLQESSQPRPKQRGRPCVPRDQVLARILELSEASTDAAILTVDLCRAVGVAERTLRNIFHEYFGIGPIRFLKVRQLQQIRDALHAADPTQETGTSVAARFGIWDFSLFARNYKRLFGEAPSCTLRTVRKPAQPNLTVRGTWLQYAARAFASQTGGETVKRRN